MTESFAIPQPVSAEKAEKIFGAPDPARSRGIGLPPIAKKAAGKLGNNKKPRSSVRALKPEDRQKIIDYYDMLAIAMMMVKPAVAEAIRSPIMERDQETRELVEVGTRAELCADAWFELAQENDQVRRFILFFIETGAWSKLAAANMPILLAALPDDVITRLFTRFMPMPNRQDAEYPAAA